MGPEPSRINQLEQSAALQIRTHYRSDALLERFLSGERDDSDGNLCCAASKNLDVEGSVHGHGD
jgi:hypothetical protein